ncbi:MAG: substrate-binding domain-containing protein [Desulfobaccales bacterium]
MIRKVYGLLAALLLSFFWSIFPLAVRADLLEIPGTGACEALLQGVADAFSAQHPCHRVTVPPSSGSQGGIRLAASDQAILARVARPLTDEEKACGLRYLVFARDMVIFAGGARVTVTGLSRAQLADVYTGKITDWQELGGDPGPIRLLVRQPSDSNLLIIQKHLPLFRDLAFSASVKVIHTDPKMLNMLEKYKYSLGWLTFSALKASQSPIRPLALDGIAPTPENARSHKYPLIDDYALVFKEKRLNDLARSFLDFVFSNNGRQVIERYGVIPIDKE